MYWTTLGFFVLVATSLHLEGTGSLVAPGAVFAGGPIIEKLLGQSTSEYSRPDSPLARFAPLAAIVGHFALIGIFLYTHTQGPQSEMQSLAHGVSLGVGFGVLGINAAHELGHRENQASRGLAWLALVSCLYGHFMVSHYEVHHDRVGTAADPCTARRGESLYRYLSRGPRQAFATAWQVSGAKPQIACSCALQILLVLVLGTCAGPTAAASYVIAGVTGIVLLESVNYLQHYGTASAPQEDDRLRARLALRASPLAWETTCTINRLMLLELTAHEAHHLDPSLQFPQLRYRPGRLTLPFGYATMILVACLPPLWFRLTDARLEAALGLRRAEQQPRVPRAQQRSNA